MAHTGGTPARAQRLIGLAATLLLALTTALAFGRVFVGLRTTLLLLATAVASAAIAGALERRSLVLATTASAIGVAFAVGLFVFPETLWYGLPTVHTLGAALHAAGAVGQQARIQVAPAEPIAPLLLAAVVSLWAAIFSAHALAFRAGSPLLGLVPPVALVAFADTVLEQFVKPLYGLAFLGAALLVVFADGLSRVQGWGPMWSSSRRGPVASAGRGARRLAATALVAGLIAPVIVPGFGSKAVIDFSTAVEGAVSLDPFVAIQNRLTKSDPVPVMRVTSPKPMYLRLVSLPVFDQRGWLPAPDQQGSPIGPQGEVFSTAPSSAVPVEVGVEVLNDLNLNYLPAPFPADRIAAPGLEVTYDSETGSAITGPISRGTTYAVSGWYVAEGADRLRAIPDQPGFGEPPQGVVDRYLATPDTLPREVEQLARQWTAGADNVFDRARLIEEHLRTFEYRDDAAFGSGPTAILEFLREQRAGFCQQFAASMAAMLRTLDIPARVVVGFTNATSVNGSWTVTSDRMHAWVEVLFNGVGWMPFEPTPFRTNPIEVVYDRGTDEPCPGPDCPDGGSTGGAPANQRGRGQQGLIDPTPALPGSRGRDPNVPEPFEGPTGPSARTKLLLAAVAAALLVLLLVPLGRWAGRRLRLRRAADEPRRLILLTYEQFTERIAGVGLGRGPGETLEEYRRRVLETGHLSDGHLDRLTRIATSAAYSGRDPDPGAARDATQAAGTALAEIRRSVGPVRWVTGLYRRT